MSCRFASLAALLEDQQVLKEAEMSAAWKGLPQRTRALPVRRGKDPYQVRRGLVGTGFLVSGVERPPTGLCTAWGTRHG